jgi:hypothetical protein
MGFCTVWRQPGAPCGIAMWDHAYSGGQSRETCGGTMRCRDRSRPGPTRHDSNTPPNRFLQTCKWMRHTAYSSGAWKPALWRRGNSIERHVFLTCFQQCERGAARQTAPTWSSPIRLTTRLTWRWMRCCAAVAIEGGDPIDKKSVLQHSNFN